MLNKEFSKLCTPAKIYFAIAVIACIIALFNGLGIISVILKLIFAFIWTFILGWLCNKGYKSAAWFLVLLPYIIFLLALVGIMRVSSGPRNFLNAIKLQGPFGKENFVNSKKQPIHHTKVK